ncbi:hypothetical protein [Streptomyces sp. YS-3]|uniref:hypothetical protein n=1 Tax=Streptomyces sp. YS-3 TaxID=3381352 RepID=UPI003862D132
MGVLLRWWLGDPEKVRQDVRAGSDAPNPFAWVDRLPGDLRELRSQVEYWMWWHENAERMLSAQRRPPAPRVVIDILPEQRIFMEELRRVLDSTGLGDQPRQLLGHEPGARAARYLSGRVIPGEDEIWSIARPCAEALKPHWISQEATLHEPGARLLP